MTNIVVGPIGGGLQNDVLPFNTDNDSFPVLINAQQWRKRIRRKRGTTQLGRLRRFFDSNDSSYIIGKISGIFSPILGTAPATITLSSGMGNLISGIFSSTDMTPITISLSYLSSNASLIPGTISITDQTASVSYTDDGNGNLVGGSGGIINYATGAFTITGGASHLIYANFIYYPDLPVLGLEDFLNSSTQFPGTIGFDTTYSYNINTSSPFLIYDVSFYKNPADGTYSGYSEKDVWTPLTWNGQDYQQFWTTNYQGAMWASNGIEVPFDITNVGMQYKAIVTDTVLTATTASLNIVGHGLVVGDFVFINEVLSTTGINFQTGYVTTVTDADNVIVTFPNATLATDGSGGIAQYLTNRSDVTKDCIRFYDGAPVTSAIPPVFQENFGWVNFCPPLISGPNNIFTIGDLPASQYYLVGARMIVPFKDRLLFLGPVIQTSGAGSQRYLQDTIIYSENGTVYYTASFPYSTVTPSAAVLASVAFSPILVPINQTAAPNAFFEDTTGYGGFITAGISQPMTTANYNEDVVLIGFTTKQTQLIYTGDDIIPFNFYVINSELGSSSTFSTVTLDQGAISVGPNGIILTSQIGAQRIDLKIPDEVFQFNLLENGIQRVCAQRDFINEWIYFTYSPGDAIDYFPGQTLIYNYRENTWAKFNESYTTYGQFRRQTGQAWDDLTQFAWDAWNDPWDSGEQTLLQPEVIAGNQQGFIMVRAEGTSEQPSGYIQNIDASSVVTSPHHNLNDGDYIIISGVLGTIGANVNGKIFSVASPATNTFTLNPTVGSGTYLGGGVFTRMYVPYVQTRQFPAAWDMARKTRIGAQRYLLTKTPLGQITLLIFLSQDSSDAFNDGPIDPSSLTNDSGLIYSTVLYTCPESTNLGLTSANSSLLMLAPGQPQAQIWHRVSTSLIGDTVQLGFTLSDEQMRNTDMTNQFAEIELHGFILAVSPSQVLA